MVVFQRAQDSPVTTVACTRWPVNNLVQGFAVLHALALTDCIMHVYDTQLLPEALPGGNNSSWLGAGVYPSRHCQQS
jgi:hypothetical protein